MLSTPLEPFKPPAFLSDLSINFSADTIVSGIFYLVLFYWAIYTAVAVYHWFVHSHNASIAVPAVALHLFVSMVLIGYIVTGLV